MARRLKGGRRERWGDESDVKADWKKERWGGESDDEVEWRGAERWKDEREGEGKGDMVSERQ